MLIFASLAWPAAAVAAPGDPQSATITPTGSNNLASLGLDGQTIPRGNNGDVTVIGNRAYVAGGSDQHGARDTTGRICTDFGGLKVVDLSTPSNPVQQSPISIAAAPGIAAPWPASNPRFGQAFANVNKSAVAVDSINMSSGSFNGNLLAVTTAACEPSFFTGGRVELYDVNNPGSPTLLNTGLGAIGYAPATVEDVDLFQSGGKTLMIVSIAFQASQGPTGEDEIWDVTNPASPQRIGRFPAVGMGAPPFPAYGTINIQVSNNGCKTFVAGRGVFASGNTAYATLYDGFSVNNGLTGGATDLDGDASRTDAVNKLDLTNTIATGTQATPVDPPLTKAWGYTPDPLAGNGTGSDVDQEGNAAAVTVYQNAGRDIGIVSEDDLDASHTTLDITSPASAVSSWRGCENRIGALLHQEPGQQVSDDIVYVGRACPSSKLTGTTFTAADPYINDPSGKIALMDSGPSPFQGCSSLERAQRLTADGAVAVMTTSGTQNSAPNSGPQGGAAAEPLATIMQPAVDAMQRVPNAVLGTSLPATWQRSSATNVIISPATALPGRPDFGRFQSNSDATDNVASGELLPANRFPVTPGAAYDVTAFMEVTAWVGGSFDTEVEFYDAGGASLGAPDTIQSLTAVTPQTRFTDTVTAPVGAATGTVRFRWTGGAASQGGSAFAFGFSATPDNLQGDLTANQDEWGGQKFVDFSQTPAQVIGSYRSPTSQVWPPPDNGFYAPREARMLGSDIALTTWLSDGLRVLDVSDPANPVELASYVPPAAADPSPASGAGSTATPPRTDSGSLQLLRGRAWPDQPLVTGVDVLQGGDNAQIVITDINGGLRVLGLNVTREAAPPGAAPPTDNSAARKKAIAKCKKKKNKKKRKKCIKKAKKRFP